MIAFEPLDKDWQDLIKAATCEQLFSKRNSPAYVCDHIIRPLTVIATCCLGEKIKPWNLSPEIINEAVSIAKSIQKSGKLADTVVGVTKNIIDINHLSIYSPIYPALLTKRLVPIGSDSRSSFIKSKDELLESLNQRKSREKLPEQAAFWELMRIIFTEKPLSFTDVIRFSALKVQTITGFRIGEVALLPWDWKRTRDYYDPSGKPAGELGGYSSALYIRHFAEKQQTEDSNSIELFENVQFVPKMFETILTEILDDAARITMPLRETLKLQCVTGRIFPSYSRSENVPVTELYTKLTGNPFWLKIDSKQRESFIERYRVNYDPLVLNELDLFLKKEHQSGNIKNLDHPLYIFFNRLVNDKSGKPLRFVKKDGSTYMEDRFKWSKVYLNIGELEEYLSINKKTKLSDLTPIKLTNGILQPWELMFLLPKRSLPEERNDGITDITRYHSVSIPDSLFLISAIGENKTVESLFQCDKRSLSLLSG